MESSGAGPRSLRRPKLSDTPLPAQSEPIPLLTSVDWLFPVYGWLPSASTFQPVLPELIDESSTGSRVVLAAGGRVVLYARYTIDSDDETVSLAYRRRCQGPYRLDLATGKVDQASFAVRENARARVHFAGSPDGRQVAVAESWALNTSPDPAAVDPGAQCTLWLAGFSGEPARELLTFAGEPGGGGADDVCLHWSPDGTKVAFSAYVHAVSASVPLKLQVLVYDVASGEQVLKLEDRCLVGSAAFSSDGTRLLVADRSNVAGIHHLDTGQGEPIPLIPMPRPDTTDRKVPRLLGFADNTRLLIAQQRGRTMTVSSTDPAGTDLRPLLRWTGGLDMYPVLAVMPEDFWG